MVNLSGTILVDANSFSDQEVEEGKSEESKVSDNVVENRAQRKTVGINNVDGTPFDHKFLNHFYGKWINFDYPILERVEEMLLDFVPRVQLHLLGFPDAFVYRENSDGSRNSLGADRIAMAIQRTFEKEVYRRWKAQTVCQIIVKSPHSTQF